MTLVVADGEGQVAGQLPPFVVPTPWWQDLEPIVAVHPDLVILRLLQAVPAPSGPMGGEVTYLAECVEAPKGLVSFEGPPRWLSDDPLRMPWARPGGPAADLAWAAQHVPIMGRPRQVRSWNLSSIWRVPTAEGECWLKCIPPFFAHEADVISRLGPSDSLPEVIAADGHRILLAAMAGEDGYQADVRQYEEILEALVGLQLQTRAWGDDRTMLVPVWNKAALGAAVADLVRRRAGDRPGLRRLVEGWDARFEAMAECGLPDVLFHGDAHPGNARTGVRPPIIFDWGDSGLGHPLLDLAVLGWRPVEEQPRLRHHWLGLWQDAIPGSRPDRAWQLLEPAAAIRNAVVFQRFLDNIEPSERIYHVNDVEPYLIEAERLLAAE